MGVEAHLNTCFKHFISFTVHYSLVDPKELAPLQELIDQFTLQAGRGPSGGGGGAGGASSSSAAAARQ